MDGVSRGRRGAFSGRFFRGYIVIGGGGDVMSSILESHFIRLMEGLDRSPLAPVRVCVQGWVCVLPLMAASKAKVVMKTQIILVFRPITANGRQRVS